MIMVKQIIIAFVLFSLSSLLVAAEPAASTDIPGSSVGSADVTISLLKVTGGLFLVIVAILASAWFYRRFGNISTINNEKLKIIGGISMGQKERVVLMQVGEEQVLLGVSPGRIQTLHVLTKPIKVEESKQPETNKFANQLNLALKQWKSQ